MAIILSNRLKAMQDAAANFGDSIQGIREAQRQAKRQAEADKMDKGRFDQDQELGGLQISAAKAKASDEENQRLAMKEAQGFADDLTGFGTAVPESAIGIQDSSIFGGAPMASPRPMVDQSAQNMKDRLTASMLNKMEQAKGGVSALTKDDIAAQRRAAQEKAAQGLQKFGLDTRKAEADIENTKIGTKKTESEIGSGRFKDVELSDNRLGVLNTRTGDIRPSGEMSSKEGRKGLDGLTEEARRDKQVFAAKDKLRDVYEKTGTANAIVMLNDIAGKIGGVDSEDNIKGIGAQNITPQFLLSQEGKDVRTSLAGLRNIVLKDRSGAAVSNQEFERLKEEIGGGIFTTDKDLRSKLKRMGDIVAQHANSIDATFQGDPEVPRQAFQEYKAAGGILGSSLNLNKPKAPASSKFKILSVEEND